MKNSKKILFSIIALVIAVVAASTSTYAWFTTNTTVSVDSFNMDVKSESDILMVSVGAANSTAPAALTGYKYKLTGTDFTTVLTDVKLDAVTSEDGKAFKNLAGDTVAASTGKYVEFALHFATTDVAAVKDQISITTLTLTNTEGTIPCVSAVAGTYNSLTVTKNQALAAKATDALRMSFTNGTTTKIYEQNATAGYGTRLATGNLAIDQYNAVMTPSTDIAATALAADYVATDVAAAGGAAIGKFTADASKTFITTTVIIRIWLEGQDADCINSALGDNVAVVMGFTQATTPDEG